MIIRLARDSAMVEPRVKGFFVLGEGKQKVVHLP